MSTRHRRTSVEKPSRNNILKTPSPKSLHGHRNYSENSQISQCPWNVLIQCDCLVEVPITGGHTKIRLETGPPQIWANGRQECLHSVNSRRRCERDYEFNESAPV